MTLLRAWYSAQLPCRADSVTMGRRLVRQVLHEWNLSAIVADAELAACELLSNAVRHGAGDVSLRMELNGSLVIIVGDDDVTIPQPDAGAGPTTDPTTGRGLRIVEQISAEWGARPAATGKEVWFRMSLPIGMAS